MTIFDKIKPPKVTGDDGKAKFPDGLWKKCVGCQEILFQADIDKNNSVCPKCEFHYKMPARARLAMITDEGSFVEYDSHLLAQDPLQFKDSKKYSDRMRDSIKNTGENEAYLYGEAKISGIPVSIGAFIFEFMGGSMGSVVGEKVARQFELALKKKMPAIIFSSSGGARMQEGIFSLMQLAKTSVALVKLRKKKIPFISVCCDPTTGGTAASFAMQGDIILAEPGALIGFAGPRVIEQTIKEKLPPGFQRAEFLLEHGMVDNIVHRNKLREILSKLLKILYKPPVEEN
jgi:acetyl-CoA carboxylase carboxyl transferase subunit beta